MARKRSWWLAGAVGAALLPLAVARLLTARAPRDESAVYEAVLREFLRQTPEGRQDVIFVSIEGRDPDPALLTRFEKWPLAPLPASRAVQRKNVTLPPLSMESPFQDSLTGRAGYICALSRVEWRWPDGAAVKVENHIGGGSWVFRWQGTRWEKSGYEPDWIS